MIFDGIMYGERKYDANGETVIYYLYDENNNKYGFVYNGKYYYYQINLQGDVIGIYDENGQLVVQYAYDAWGKLLSVTGTLANTIGQINPIRYRGYYYDNETGFYYLQSRYYDPETGRFINADSQLNAKDLNGYNMFSYCSNNPVNNIDPDGHSWKSIKNWFKSKIISAKKSIAKVSQWTNKNIIKPISKFLKNSVEIEVGTGFGLAGEVDYYGVGVDVNLKTDMPHIKINDKGYEECNQTDIGITVDLLALEVGPHLIGYDNEKPSEFTFYQVKDTITLFSLGGAFFYGFNFSVNVDYLYVYDCVVKIFD